MQNENIVGNASRNVWLAKEKEKKRTLKCNLCSILNPTYATGTVKYVGEL